MQVGILHSFLPEEKIAMVGLFLPTLCNVKCPERYKGIVNAMVGGVPIVQRWRMAVQLDSSML